MRELRGMRSERDRSGMARFGINTERALGISVTRLRRIARELGRDHELAAALWSSEVHEARILAILIEEHDRVTIRQMEVWARDFDSWDLVDLACIHLFSRTPHASKMAERWAGRRAEFVKRAAFALIASLAARRDADVTQATWRRFLSLCEREAWDDRNFVRKAVNWAVRQIGKRDDRLRPLALRTAHRILSQDTRSARWIAKDALRELERA